MLGLGNSLITGEVPSSGFLQTSISDFSLWLKNGTDITAAQWNDSSGNSNHITQSSSGLQASVTGGGLEFEGDNDDHYDLTTDIDMGDSFP